MKVKIGDGVEIDLTRLLKYLEVEHSNDSRTKYDLFQENVNKLLREGLVVTYPVAVRNIKLEDGIKKAQGVLSSLLSKRRIK